MLDSAGNFNVTAVNHWPLVRIAKVAASPLHNVAGCGIVVAALRAFEALSGWLEFTLEPAFETLVNWCVRAEVTDSVVCVVPNGFECLGILFQIRVFAVVNEPASAVFRIVFFKVNFFKRCWCFPHIVVETVRIVLFIGNILHAAELLDVGLAERVGQTFSRGSINAEVVAVFVFPLLTGS